jgi:hypothetical protein
VSDSEVPDKDGKEVRHDLDLGDGHWIDWMEYEGEKCGGIITHTTAKTETGLCQGTFWLASFKGYTHGHPVWQMSGTFGHPTLVPSFRCHCGDHGFVRDGKWVKA